MNFGYIPNPEATERFCAALPTYLSQQVESLRPFARDGKPVYLWLPLAKVLGKDAGTWRLPARNQGAKGTCVGVSEAGLLDLLAAADIVERNDPEEWRGHQSAVHTYIAGRMVAKMLGKGDGLFGSAIAEAMNTIGVLPSGKYGTIDLPEYSIPLIEKWDRRGVGLPEELIEAAKEHTIQKCARITTIEQLDACLYQYYPVNICSDWGSNDQQRDKDGCLRGNGNWPHSMHVCGIHFTASGVKIYIIRNSWGDWMEGKGPLVCVNMPMGSFGIREADMMRILKQGDSFARAGYEGFKRRKIDFDKVFSF